MLARLGQANNEPVKSTLCNWSHDAIHKDFLVEMKKNKYVYSDRTLILGFKCNIFIIINTDANSTRLSISSFQH